MTDHVLIVAAVTVVVGLLVPFGVRPLLTRLMVVDVPSARSSHERPVLRGAGTGVAVAIVTGLLVTMGLGIEPGSITWLLLTTVVLTASLGFVEDVRGVPIGVRLGAQVLIGGLVGAWLAGMFGQALLLPLAMLVVPVLVNVANFMDGVDNLSGLVVMVFGIAHLVLLQVTADAAPASLIAAGAVVASAGLGFLPWNNGNHKLFLGDSGSYLIGGAMSVLTLSALASGAPVLAVLGPVAVYLADTAYTLTSRVLRRQRWHESHRQHRYHQLEDLGWSHVRVALTVAVTTAVTSALGILGTIRGSEALCAAAIAVVCTAYVASPWALLRRASRTVSR